LKLDSEETGKEMIPVDSFDWEIEPEAEEKYVVYADNQPFFWIWIPFEYFEPTRKDIE
jgi:hypothetical protein